MYTRILVPLDGSELAEQALPYARALAHGLGIPVDVVAVVDPEPLSVLANPDQGRTIDTLVAESVSAMSAYLRPIKHDFDRAPVTERVEIGKPEDVLIEKAAADKNTLIIMATHGRSGIQRWMLGSVADKVLHGAANHMLLIRATEQGKTYGEASLTSVVVPLDGSPLAEQVLPHVTELAKKMKLDIALVRAYALPPAVATDYGFYSGELLDQLEEDARDYLEEKARQMREAGVKNVSSLVHIGYGAEEIIQLAQKTPDNLIAMCSHGRSGIKRWVLGSVTERVVRHSGDPVLIIRAA
ncbi:MAG TPA: universal stress protein [Candidatus Binatia bacterium]|jgi:nucleotide-binding universal stress UspA family protein